MSNSVREQLRQSAFLAGVTDTAIHQLGKVVEPRHYEAGSRLFEEGAQRRFVAILISGAIAIEKSVNGQPVRLATLG
ncbi:MAG TPA: hypothetical protein VF483_06260, partial [Gemmatimonadaceae bacterium]